MGSLRIMTSFANRADIFKLRTKTLSSKICEAAISKSNNTMYDQLLNHKILFYAIFFIRY